MDIPLAEPNLGTAEEAAVIDALRSGWINTTGPYVQKLEQKLCEITNTKACAAVANGTAGLFLALKALGIGPGHQVIVPSITFVATINAIIHAGAEPIFIGCDASLNINYNNIKQFLLYHYRPNIKAIIPVHIFGNPCDMTHIVELAQQYNLKVIEDSCEALGSIHIDGPCGSLGDAGVFSFSFNKMITSGNGGAVVSNNTELIKYIQYLSKQAKDDPINYIHNSVGYNLGLTNIQAAIGYTQLERLNEFLVRKQEIFFLYKNQLSESCVLISPMPYTYISNYWFVGLYHTEASQITKTLAAQGIQTRPLWTPNHLQKPFKQYQSYNVDHLERYQKKIINLPCGTTLTDEQIIHICDIINKDIIRRENYD